MGIRQLTDEQFDAEAAVLKESPPDGSRAHDDPEGYRLSLALYNELRAQTKDSPNTPEQQISILAALRSLYVIQLSHMIGHLPEVLGDVFVSLQMDDLLSDVQGQVATMRALYGTDDGDVASDENNA